MSDDINGYSATTADWRKTLRQNNTRTYIVIFIFFLIYCGIGILVDMFLRAETYPQADLSQLFFAIVTFKLFPIATLIMFGIATISLLITYKMYDKIMLLGTEYHEITADGVKTANEAKLYNVVEEMKIAAGLRYMPRVFIIDADYMNAFASGYSEKSAMIAITRGLMDKLDRDELQAVIAHELSHIRHLDIKLTMTASLLANMMIIVLDIMFRSSLYSSEGRSKSRNRLFILIMFLRFALPVINILLLFYLSRRRELMADAGAVELTRTNEPLARALLKIENDYTSNTGYNIQNTPHENIRREAYIYDPTESGFLPITSLVDLFSTHPSLAQRLQALGFKKKS